MNKRTSSQHFYQTMTDRCPMTGSRFPHPVFTKQKTNWMRFLLFCLYGCDTAALTPQPIPVQNRQPCPNRY
ncbi:MAG: hypothetical protein GY803_30465 [Chloroflexi bacterium]|nr:hypothetical protein [Chloroflexota bacterium]